MTTGVVVQWTRPKLTRLKKELAGAIAEKKDVFVFDGHELLVTYAEYLVEYLESQFNQRRH